MELDYWTIFKELNEMIPYDKLKNKAITVELEEVNIPTISIHDLIELKSRAGRKQDISDVEHLRMVLER